MPKKASKSDNSKDAGFPSDQSLIEAGYFSEQDMVKKLGCTWSTWERDYRDRIAATITPSGRWYHHDSVVEWWTTSMDCACSE